MEHEVPLFSALFVFLLAFLGALLGSFFLCFDLVIDFFLLLIFRIVHAHAGKLVFDRHDGMREEHACLAAVHDAHEFLRLFRAKARTVATVTDGLRDAVGAAVHLCHDSSKQRRTLWTELIARGVVIVVAIDHKGLLDILLFLWNVVFEFRRFPFGQEFGKKCHDVITFLLYGCIIEKSSSKYCT